MRPFRRVQTRQREAPAAPTDSDQAAPSSEPIRARPAAEREQTVVRWGPRAVVFAVLALVIGLGGGRRLLIAARARKAREELEEADVEPETVLDAARYGRSCLFELFRLLNEAARPEIRQAAGRALARIWAQDELIPEEERAIVRQGFEARWTARRRYPRAIQVPIPFEVSFGVPFLNGDTDEDAEPRVRADDLEWSYRIIGAERASLEAPSPWVPGGAGARFTIDPSDFPAHGPHRLVFKPRVRTAERLTSRWELELPEVATTFEFDDQVKIEALLTHPDIHDQERLSCSIQLDAVVAPTGSETRFLELTSAFVLRDPPDLTIREPLPADLAHRIVVEFDHAEIPVPAGVAIITDRENTNPSGFPMRLPIGPLEGLPDSTFERPGDYRLRVRLEPDPHLGWADPRVRSLWPEAITTDWVAFKVIRR